MLCQGSRMITECFFGYQQTAPPLVGPPGRVPTTGPASHAAVEAASVEFCSQVLTAAARVPSCEAWRGADWHFGGISLLGLALQAVVSFESSDYKRPTQLRDPSPVPVSASPLLFQVCAARSGSG
jgi:hypothetical protein